MKHINKIFYLSIILALLSVLLYFHNNTYADNNYITVHFIDVGQGDASLIQVNGLNMLIDSGPESNRYNIISYLDNLKITTLDYIIATHPHEDHIGNMATIIKKYTVKNFYAPKVTHNSVCFENMIGSLSDKKLKINILNTSTYLNLGENTNISIFSPPPNYFSDNFNNHSPIIKIQYGNISFLFTGDAESEIEQMVLLENSDIQCNVLKIGHHGSSTSSTPEFISKANPDIAVISVGKKNSYGHPATETITTLNNNNVTLLRTDKIGNIVLCSDGTNIFNFSYK